ncbi:MAG: ASCH domain-containing protein [Gammaproteobacteria bacterium]|nr:ASCH domain-containing protein [Gammaproteobacteria bacterium]
MKALSIRQPWAFAIVNGWKPVENRTWPTRYRGRILIHAGKKEETEDIEGVLEMIAGQTGLPILTVIEMYFEQQRTFGGIVGAATLVDCVTSCDSSWFAGPYGFVLRDAIRYEYIPCRGALGFFDVFAHNDILKNLETGNASDQ